MVTLEQLKIYARVGHDAEDDLITGILAAAQSAVADMTGKDAPKNGDELYDTAVLQLAAHWYENRTPTETGAAVSEVPFTLPMLLNHIALCGRYPPTEGGANDGTV